MSGIFISSVIMMTTMLFLIFTMTGECQKDECYMLCPLEHNPVCASNGITYDSMCHFQVAACRLNHKISILRHGSCV